jgi:MoCo/4Fe-4S cofactor protein with predicted Tat translocation signal
MSADPTPAVPVTLQGVRRRLDGTSGRRYWKSLEELAESPGFLEFLHREFPEQASVFEDPKGRREFLTVRIEDARAHAGRGAATLFAHCNLADEALPREKMIANGVGRRAFSGAFHTCHISILPGGNLISPWLTRSRRKPSIVVRPTRGGDLAELAVPETARAVACKIQRGRQSCS